jgi:hypothetical protein
MNEKTEYKYRQSVKSNSKPVKNINKKYRNPKSTT